MYKFLYLVMVLLLADIAYGQEDTSKIKFRPGTLVGKYYGTYDTAAKKTVESPTTKLITNRQFTDSTRLNPLTGNTITGKPQIEANQKFDPIEISGTTHADKLDIQSGTDPSAIKINSLTEKPELKINQNVNPIEVSGTGQVSHLDVASPQTNISGNAQQLTSQPSMQLRSQVAPPVTANEQRGKPNAIYRDTRLGSSSPQYDTYEKNQDGAGSVTTAPKSLNTGSALPPAMASDQKSPAQKNQIYRPTRLGSSSPQYDTYQKNDYGAGAVTNTPKSRNAGSSMPVEVSPVSKGQSVSAISRDTRLGSSSPQYNTYEKNKDGAGSVTTNPNKNGGGGVPVFIEPIKPEQSQSDSTAAGKTGDIKSEKGDK